MKCRSMRMDAWSIMNREYPAMSKNSGLLLKLFKIWGVIGLVSPSDEEHKYSSRDVIASSGLTVSSFSRLSYHS